MKRITVSVNDKLYEELKHEDVSPSFLIRYGFKMLQQHKLLNEKYYRLEGRIDDIENRIQQILKRFYNLDQDIKKLKERG